MNAIGCLLLIATTGKGGGSRLTDLAIGDFWLQATAAFFAGAVVGAGQLAIDLSVREICRNNAWKWTVGYSALCAVASLTTWLCTRNWNVAEELGLAYPFFVGLAFPTIVFARLASVSSAAKSEITGQIQNVWKNITWIFKREIVLCNAKEFFELARELYWLDHQELVDALNQMLAVKHFWRTDEERKQLINQLNDDERRNAMTEFELVELVLSPGIAELIRPLIPWDASALSRIDGLETRILREIVSELELSDEGNAERTKRLESLDEATSDEIARQILLDFIQKHCRRRCLTRLTNRYCRLEREQ